MPCSVHLRSELALHLPWFMQNDGSPGGVMMPGQLQETFAFVNKLQDARRLQVEQAMQQSGQSAGSHYGPGTGPADSRLDDRLTKTYAALTRLGLGSIMCTLPALPVPCVHLSVVS